jgi:hypothetical protein
VSNPSHAAVGGPRQKKYRILRSHFSIPPRPCTATAASRRDASRSRYHTPTTTACSTVALSTAPGRPSSFSPPAARLHRSPPRLCPATAFYSVPTSTCAATGAAVVCGHLCWSGRSLRRAPCWCCSCATARCRLRL